MNAFHRLIGTAALAISLVACGGIKHTVITQPNYVARSPEDLQKISPITSVREHNGTLYVGGQKGLAALDATGKVLWSVDMPQTLVRLVDVDDKYVAWTSYDITGLDEAEGAKSFFLGRLGDEPKYGNAMVGLASASDGKVIWSVKSSEDTALSPPAISPVSIGVTRGMKFAIHSLDNGSETLVPFLEEAPGSSWGIVKGMIAQATRNRPVVWKGHYFAGFFNDLVKIDLQGKPVFNSTNFGLFSPFEDITVGPVAFKDRLIFGATPTQKKATLFGATEEPDKDWKEYIDDQSSGPGSIATNSKHIIVATNFHVTAFDEKGNDIWDAVNGGGGLYPGKYRGLRFVKNFGTRKSHGNLLVATDKHVYTSSAYGKGDAITVLDAATGKYVESINVDEPIIDLAAVGNSLAVVLIDRIQFIRMKE